MASLFIYNSPFPLMKCFVLALCVIEIIVLKGKYFPLHFHFLDETYLLASLCVAIELILCTVDWLKVRESILKLQPITRLQTVCLTVGSVSKLVIKNITIIAFGIVIMLG